MKVFVIIPAHNEAKYISSVIKQSLKYSKNVVVVDDGSGDNTAEISERAGAVVLRHTINLGKGAALRTGSRYAARNNADIIIFIDSDGQHNPKDIPRLLNEVKDADIVFTYRDMKSLKMPITKKLGNGLLNMMLSLLFKIELRDTQCGFKVLTRKAYNKIDLISSDYYIESEIAAKTGKYGLCYSTGGGSFLRR